MPKPNKTISLESFCEFNGLRLRVLQKPNLAPEELAIPHFFPNVPITVFDGDEFVAHIDALLALCHIMDDSKRFGICDSTADYAGEICYQMFSPDVGRAPYPVGAILMADSIGIQHEGLVLAKGFMQAVIESALQAWVDSGLLPDGVPVYFAYFGCDSLDNIDTSDPKEITRTLILSTTKDKMLHDAFQECSFAVFRCEVGVCADESSYIALYSSEAIGNDEARKAQAAVPEWADEDCDDDCDDIGDVPLPDGCVDKFLHACFDCENEDCPLASCNFEESLGETLAPVEMAVNAEGTAFGAIKMDLTVDNFGRITADAFVANGEDKAKLFSAELSYLDFTDRPVTLTSSLADPDNPKRFIADIAQQLFFPAVHRAPMPLGRLLVLETVKMHNRALIEANPEGLGQCLMTLLAVVEERTLAIPENDGPAYIAYFGIAETDEEDEALFSDDSEMTEKLATDALLYSLLRSGKFGIVRNIFAGAKNAKAKNAYIAFCSSEALLDEAAMVYQVGLEEFPEIDPDSHHVHWDAAHLREMKYESTRAVRMFGGNLANDIRSYSSDFEDDED